MKRVLISSALVTTLFLGASFNAAQVKSNDNIAFTLKTPTSQSNASTSTRWRQTSNVNNKWKVNMTTSNEPGASNTINTFWLEHSNGANVSTAHDVKEGTGNHYYVPYTSANESYVRLTTENNNFDNNSYTVSGFWDEEIN